MGWDTPEASLLSSRVLDQGGQASQVQAQFRAHLAGAWDAQVLGEETGQRIDVTTWNLGSMVLTAGHCPRRTTQRSARHIRSDQIDHYYLQLGNCGRSFDSDGERKLLAPQQLLLRDMTRPAGMTADAGWSLQVFVPREALDRHLQSPDALNGLVLQGAASSVLREHLLSLSGSLPGMQRAEAEGVAVATLYLIAASIEPTRANLGAAKPAIERSIHRQACRFIATNLQDPELSAERVCTALKLSRATLYRLFDGSGGVSTYIREQRLTRIHEAIASGGGKALAVIAEEHGFNDPSGFHRAFKQFFGYRPGDVVADTKAPSGELLNAQAGSPFGSWLRSLRA